MQYIKKKRKVNINGEVVDKYVAAISYNGNYSEEDLAEDISHGSTAAPSEVSMYIRLFEYYIAKRVAMGEVVRLGHLGTFYPTIHAEVQDTAADVTWHTIKRRGVLFRPSKEFQKELDEAQMTRAHKGVFKAIDHRKKTAPEEE